jgi:hypothetical protein
MVNWIKVMIFFTVDMSIGFYYMEHTAEKWHVWWSEKKLCSPAKNQIGPASSWGRSIHSPTCGWYYSFSWNKGTLFLTFILVNDNIGAKECTKGISNGATQNGRPNCPCVSFCVDVKMVIFLSARPFAPGGAYRLQRPDAFFFLFFLFFI